MPQTAKVLALRFLKIRPRSIHELRVKLEAKAFAEEEIATTVNYLTAIGLLDDRAFTRSWISYRLARPFGFRRIILELQQKGVAQELIDEVVAEIKPQANEIETLEMVARRRFERLLGDAQQKKRRVADYLARRGFEAGDIYKVLKKL